MKRCFVIMPYGGDDPVVAKRFQGVYQAIIAPAARLAGYEPKRSDIAGAPGNITHDIIRDLADSDVVIADLTTGNANVFFELGIRHAFRKSGTVHIVDASHLLPFDVRQYRAIEYSAELASIPDVIAKIAEAIQRRESEPARADNPVHDALPELPFDIMATSDSAMKDQLLTLQTALKEASTRNEQLTERLMAIDPSGTIEGSEPETNVDSLLDRADAIMKTTGRHAILRLRQVLDDSGSDSFVKTLREVLKSPYLDENDFTEIVIICRQAGLNEHRRATCEIARKRYPHSDEMLLLLVDALDDSPNLDDQQRGRILLEQRLRIDSTQGRPTLSQLPPIRNLNQAIGFLFNFYNRQRRYDWILSLTDSLPERLRSDAMVLRNRASALAALNRPDEAHAVFAQAMELDPRDDQTFVWYSSFLDDQGKFEEAYELSEKAIQADPEDPRLYLHMAIFIFNRGYVRGQDGRIVGTVPRNVRASFSVPFIMRAIADKNGDIVEEAVRILVRGGAVAEAQAIASGEAPKGRYDTAALDHILAHGGASLTAPGN